MTASRPVYDTIGQAYVTHRRPDPRWTALVRQALGPAAWSGTGSYEPDPPVQVVAVEPSPLMIGQRIREAAPVTRASGTALPLLDASFDAALAVLTLHHWGDWRAGFLELARVAPRRVVLTIDFEVHAHFWLLSDYLPEVAAVERELRPSPADIAEVIGVSETIDLPLPTDFADGVLGAFWNRPGAYLDPIVRRNTSPLALAEQAMVGAAMTRLESDLAEGTWHRRHGHLLELESCDLGYRLLISS